MFLTVMQTKTTRETLIAPPERLSDRLSARLHPRTLDVALANGTPSEASGALALRARRLTAHPRRRALAAALCALVRERSSGPLRGVPIRGRVAAADEELTALAARLTRPDPVAARGVAQALLLLTDGTGPLYNPRSPLSVRALALTALGNLEIA
jgi:hypothetical protein